MRLLPGDTRELRLQRSTMVFEPVAFLGRKISTPVADFDVALDKLGVEDGLGEVVPDGDILLCSSWNIGIRTVGEAGALLLRVILALLVLANDGVLWRIGGCELELGLLLGRFVGRGSVGTEAELDILLVCLVDAGRDGLERGKNRIGDGEGDLVRWRKRGRELDEIVLGRAGSLLMCGQLRLSWQKSYL